MGERQDSKGLVSLRIVGRRRAPARMLQVDHDGAEDVIAWRRAFSTPFVPRGVYRFKTHQEADEWLWKTITRPTGR